TVTTAELEHALCPDAFGDRFQEQSDQTSDDGKILPAGQLFHLQKNRGIGRTGETCQIALDLRVYRRQHGWVWCSRISDIAHTIAPRSIPTKSMFRGPALCSFDPFRLTGIPERNPNYSKNVGRPLVE